MNNFQLLFETLIIPTVDLNGIKAKESLVCNICWPCKPLSTPGTLECTCFGLCMCLLCVCFPSSKLELSGMDQAEVKSVKEKRGGIGHLQLFKNPSGKGQGGSITNRHKPVDLEITFTSTLADLAGVVKGCNKSAAG